MNARILAAAAVAASACTTVQVTRTKTDEGSCAVRFYRLGPPDTPHDEVGSALLEGSVFVTPQRAEDDLRERACELGADGVVLTQELYATPFVGARVTAVFIKNRSG